MTQSSVTIDPYFSGRPVAEVGQMRVRAYQAGPEGAVPWHEKTASNTLVFCHSGKIAVQIKKPPFRCVLKRGQCYMVPAGVAMTLYAVTEEVGLCTIFEYGGQLDAIVSEPANLGFCFDRLDLDTGFDGMPGSLDYGDFTPGFSRMDVLHAAPQLRLIVQGHGPSQCVPWHSHDNVSDAFFCLKGRARIATREPDQVVELDPGDSFTVAPGIAHFVSGERGKPCEMLVLQGVGTYNYVSR